MKRRIGLLLLACVATSAGAHKASDAYLTLDTGADGGAPVLRIDVALRDLDRVVGLDMNGDRRVTWAELQRHQPAIVALVRRDIEARAGDGACPLRDPRLAVAEHTDGGYAALALRVACPDGTAPDTLRYGLLFDSDPLHRGLLVIEDGHDSRSLVFTPERRERALGSESTGLVATLRDYTVEGVWHIWIGLDHLLFLAVLMLPAALAGDARPARVVLQVAKVVTAFTLAHSVTLGLAVLGYVSVPSFWVEAGIAASIVLAAAANVLWPRAAHMGWMLAFAFGLVHGLGFAGVLQGLGLPGDALAVALLAFNLGVELGQLAVVVAVMPPLLAAARTTHYRSAILPAGSIAAAVVGGVWLLERVG